MKTCSHETSDVRHIHHQICSDFIRDLAKPLEINGACIGAGAGNDHLRLTFLRDLKNFIVIDHALIVNAVWYNIKIFSRHIDR